MGKYCLCCGEKIGKKRVFCCEACNDIYHASEKEKKEIYELLHIIADPNAVNALRGFVESTFQDQRVMKKKLFLAQQSLVEQNNLWDNLMGDIIDEDISPAFIRWWSRKLVDKHNLDSKNRILGWLQNVAEIIDIYSKAKNT